MFKKGEILILKLVFVMITIFVSFSKHILDINK